MVEFGRGQRKREKGYLKIGRGIERDKQIDKMNWNRREKRRNWGWKRGETGIAGRG